METVADVIEALKKMPQDAKALYIRFEGDGKTKRLPLDIGWRRDRNEVSFVPAEQ